MRISEFIAEVRDKRTVADVSLPKYKSLISTSLKENDKELVDGSTIDWTIAVNNSITTTSKVTDHLKKVSEKDYDFLNSFIEKDAIPEFNEYFKEYLIKESGYSADLRIKTPRPGSSGPRLIVDRLITSADDVEMALAEGYIPSAISKLLRPKWYQRLLAVFSKRYYDTLFIDGAKRFFWGSPKTPSEIEKMRVKFTVEDFFNNVRVKVDSSEDFRNHLKAIVTQITNAKKMNQVALVETLSVKAIIEVYEGCLIGSDFKKYITLEDLQKLSKVSPRGLSIDYVSDFARVIPQDVIDKKELADKLNIFDNYVILHFDPENKNTAQTIETKEENRKKDPILFGIIQSSEKLYYIADWIDEYCDLTWDKALEMLSLKDNERELALKK